MGLQNLDTFLRRTRKLARELRALIKLYPEDHLEPDLRIFNRLLANEWRHLCTYHGPMEWRYLKAVEWIEALTSYDSELREFCRYELNAPAKLEDLPMYPLLPLSGTRCLHLLELQSKVLTRWKDEDAGSRTPARLAKIRRDLQVLVDQSGLKRPAAEIGVNRDTLRDLLAGKTKPQEKTLDRIESRLNRRKSTD